MPMATHENWSKLITFLLIGSLAGSVVRIVGLVFLSEPASYVVSLFAVLFFLYLGSSEKVHSFLRNNRILAALVAGGVVIQMFALAHMFPAITLSGVMERGFTSFLPMIFISTLIFTLVTPVVVFPYFISYNICIEKNRNPLKGIVLTMIFGLLAPLGMWLALKTRNPQTKQLY